MIVVDVESTGVEPESMSLLSIGALDFENPENQFYEECCAWNGAEISEDAIPIHGFSREQITDTNKQSEAELIKNFIEWASKIDERTLAGHAFWLDYSFLTAAAKRAGLDWNLGYRYVDSHSVSYFYFSKNKIEIPTRDNMSALGLGKISEFVGISKLPLPHNALTDAKATAEVFSRLMHGKNLLPEYKDDVIPEILKQ